MQDLNPGGGQRVCREISRILFARGHNITIVVPKGRANTTVEGAEIIEAGFASDNPSVSILRSLPAMLKAMPKQDVIISSMPFMGILNFLKRGIKLKYHLVQSDDYRLFDDRNLIKSRLNLISYKISALLSYQLPLTFWFNSNWTKSRVELYRKLKRYHIINPGIDPDIFRPLEYSKKQEFLAGVFLKHGRQVAAQNLRETINLLREDIPDLRLRIFSKDKIDSNSFSCKTEIISPATDSELVEKLNECSLLIGASRDEGFYLPGLEAMACGIPVVMTDSGGCADYAENEFNCILIDQDKPQRIAEGVQKILSENVLRENIIKNGLKTAADFTWEKTVDKIESILEKDLTRL
jgi:glycosyltransferase involved in cell wall biosynthesis